MCRILNIDLKSKACEVVERSDLSSEYIGGVGVASQLFSEMYKQNTDPLSPDNPIVFAIGPLNAIFPCMSKVVAVFKSPLTNEYGESHAGGRFGAAMRFAGYDAIAITGGSERAVYISIHGDDVVIKNAEVLGGTRSIETVGRVLREIETGSGRRSILRIGRAGENLVKYANVNVDTYRHFGRLGLGAVFGSKKLKALVIEGTKSFNIPDLKKYREIYDEIYNEIVKTDEMEKYHDLGTMANILPLNHISGLPTRNFSSGNFEHAENISGENFAEHLLARKVACVSCPIGCIHIASQRELFGKGHDYDTRYIAYDYEPVYSLGSNLGIKEPKDILTLIDACEDYGIDSISAGVALSWATEAFKNGRITNKETDNIIFDWNNADGYYQAIANIANAKNEFYQALGFGVEYVSKKYGGSDYAIAIGNNENAGYHTGIAHVLGMALGMRHSHLDNAGYSIDQKNIGKNIPVEEIIDKMIKEEEHRSVFNSLVGCLFARGVYTTDKIIRCLSAAGMEKTEEELEEIGKKIYRKRNELRIREGFKLSGIRIPKRLLDTPSAGGNISQEQIQQALKYYAVKTNTPY